MMSNRRFALDNNSFGLTGLTFRFSEKESEGDSSVLEHYPERTLEYRSVGGAWTTKLECTFVENRIRIVARTGNQGETIFSGRME